MDAWFEGLRKGRAFVTTGPLVEFTVNGRIPGEDVAIARASDPSTSKLTRSITPEKVVLVFNAGRGRVPRERRADSIRPIEVLSRSRERLVSPSRRGQPEERYLSMPPTRRPSPILSGCRSKEDWCETVRRRVLDQWIDKYAGWRGMARVAIR
jgi:hypothetical protein